MLLKRVLIGVIGIPLLVFLILDRSYNHFPFFIFMLFLNVLAQNELHHIFQLKKVNLNKIYYLISSVILLSSFYWSLPFLPTYMFSFLIIMYAILLLFKNHYEYFIQHIAYYTFGLFYVTFLSGHFLLLKLSLFGSYYLFLIVFLIWLNDTFAYFFGVLFGKTKLHIKASPKKSYAGLVGGVIFSIISIFITEALFQGKIFFSFMEKILIGVLFSLTTTFADLVESAIKRSVNLKDSSHIIPGHGGFLDRFDTWFITIPLFYYFLKIMGKL